MKTNIRNASLFQIFGELLRRAFSPNVVSFFVFGACMALFAMPAFAQAGGGLGSVNSLMETVLTTLTDVSLVALTIAVVVAGYKVVFTGASFQEVIPIVVGGILMGAAGQIAGFFV